MIKNGDSVLLTLSKKISNFIKHLSLWLAGVFLLINISDILISVFFRYFLKYSLVWTEEVARFTLIYAVMFSAPAALSYGEHVSISVIVDRLPAPVAGLVKWIRNILIVGILILMTYLGIKYTGGAWRFKTLALGIPKAVPMMAIPIGMGLLFIQYILLEIVSKYNTKAADEGGDE